MGQAFTYYETEAERAHPDNKSGGACLSLGKLARPHQLDRDHSQQQSWLCHQPDAPSREVVRSDGRGSLRRAGRLDSRSICPRLSRLSVPFVRRILCRLCAGRSGPGVGASSPGGPISERGDHQRIFQHALVVDARHPLRHVGHPLLRGRKGVSHRPGLHLGRSAQRLDHEHAGTQYRHG